RCSASLHRVVVNAAGVVSNQRVVYLQRGMTNVCSVIVDTTADVATDDAIIEYQHCVVIVDTSFAFAGIAVGDSQPGNGDGLTRSDVKHGTFLIVIDRKILGAWS